MTDHVLMCFCSCPNAASAQTLADALVNERLAACVQCLPEVRSTYRWQGKVTTESEALLLIKTTTDRFEDLRQRLLQLHPYQVPELVAIPVERGHHAYLDWVHENVQA